MSEKRHRQQQRRQRRKAQSRSRTGRAEHSFDRRATAEMTKLLADMAEIAARDAHEPATALDAEQWASSMIGTFRVPAIAGEDAEAIVVPGFVDALEALGTPAALATLRALAAVAAPDLARLARAAGERLAASGVADPPWAQDLGVRPRHVVQLA